MFALVSDNVLRPRLVALHTELGIKIFTLPWQHLVIVKIWLHLKVPLPYHSCLVSCFAEKDWQRLLRGKNAPAQIGNSVHVWVLPSYDTRSTWCTNGIRTKHIVEYHPLCRQPIQSWSRVKRFQYRSIRSYRLGSVIVRHYEEYIGSVFSDGFHNEACEQEIRN